MFFNKANAQFDYRPGYIITHDNDTIEGKILYSGDNNLCSRCKFKNDSIKKNIYSPATLKAYRFIEGRYFVSKKVDNQIVFLELLIDGELDVFYYRNSAGNDVYYIERDTIPLTELKYEEKILYRPDGTMYESKSKRHQAIIKYCTADAPSLADNIDDIEEPKHENLISIVKQYHDVVCDGNNCIVYSKEIPAIKIYLEPILGIQNITPNEEDTIIDKSYLSTGVLAHFWLPRENEKLYFKTGLIYSRYEYTNSHKHLAKIPVCLEVQTQRGINMPRISYGINYYLNSEITVSCNLGIVSKINNKWRLSVAVDLEFDQYTLFFPDNFLAYSIHSGIIYKF